MQRHDFVWIFDVKDGNPNGDPDAGNLPRTDPETGQGLVTDVCLKRKIRNYIDLSQPDQRIHVREGEYLTDHQAEAYSELPEIDPKLTGAAKEAAREAAGRQWMCQNFWDVRMFGAVMGSGSNKEHRYGQLRGPVQISFARSIDPILTQTHSLARTAAVSEENPEVGLGASKHTIPYAMYKAVGSVSGPLAEKAGVTEKDLGLLWEAINNVFEQDHSATRGWMSTCLLAVWKHESPLGNASVQSLHDLVSVIPKKEVCRCKDDYNIVVAEAEVPGVTLTTSGNR